MRKPPAEEDGGARRVRLLAFLDGLEVADAGPVGDDTVLISSGLFDSLALFRLVEWIEKETGGPVDPSSLDFAREWDTVPGILAFVERRCSGGGAD
jgi:acyl carrier protein